MKSYLLLLTVLFSVTAMSQVSPTSGQVSSITTNFSFNITDGQYNRPLLKTGWLSGIGDYMSLKHGGNNTEANTYGLRISDAAGFDFGKNDFSTSFLKIKTNGLVGIGTNSPNSLLHIKSYENGTESFVRFQVSDSPGDYFQILNTTGAANQFIPAIRGYRESDNRYSIQLMGLTSDTNDNGGNALVNFDARRNNGPIQTRPLFVWTSYTDKKMTMLANGNLGIGTTNPGSYKLAVNGHIRAKEIKVETGWADYVFAHNYDLPSLDEVEQHIKEKGHLINIPSAKEVEENGVQLGEMNKLLLEKIEELTLYTLQQEKELQQQKEKNQRLEERLVRLEELFVNNSQQLKRTTPIKR